MSTMQYNSPNKASRKAGQTPLAIVYHITVGTAQSVIQTFMNPATEKSTHYLILKNGDVVQFVPESMSAWSNGIVWKPTARMVLERLAHTEYNPNDWTLSIEHEVYTNEPLTEAQYTASAQLTDRLTKLYDISLDTIHLIRHNSIRASKSCPGKLNIDKIIRMVLEKRNPNVDVAYNTETITKLNAIRLTILKLQEILSNLLRSRSLGAIKKDSEK